MSDRFKLNFDEMQGGDAAKKENDNQSFDSPGPVRNLCFVWPDGKKKFLNYAYLIGCDYLPDDHFILLKFTSETVQLKGSLLDPLFEELLNHIPKRIISTDERYAQIGHDKTVITEISIIEKEQG